MSDSIIKKTVAAISLLGVSLAHAPAVVADEVPSMPRRWEKCFGVAKKGMNDCTSFDGNHGCSHKSPADNDPNEYIWLPKGSCEKIPGGTTYGLNSQVAIRDRVCLKLANKKDF